MKFKGQKMLKKSLLFLLLAQASAFSNLQHKTFKNSKLDLASKYSIQMIGMDPTTVRNLVAIPTMYSLMSVNEYVTHRYYQHAEFNKEPMLQNIAMFLLRKEESIKIKGGGHVEHHAETYDDMSLKTDDKRWMESPAAIQLNSDPYRGTGFSWFVTGLMMIQMLPTTIPVFHLLGFTILQTIAWIIPSILLHTIIWNTLHPDMHGLPSIPLSVGPPSEWLAGLRNTAYFRWLYQNHQGHHVAGGQANYNVCCPLVDHLAGTYMSEEEWRPKMRPTKKEPKGVKEEEEQLVAL